MDLRAPLSHPLPPPLSVPRGWGMRALPAPERRAIFATREMRDLMAILQVYEPPRRGKRYVLSADIGDGVGQDRSVADITRVADVEEPDEQVAQFISDDIDPIDFAAYLNVIGRYYRGADNLDAVAAIETNGHGMATQSELQKRWGYQNFWVWQKEDHVDPDRRFSNSIGFQTNRFTRPFVITRYIKRLKTFDPNSGRPDYKINSPFTIQELRTFRKPPGGSLGDAEADPNDPAAKDDCIMAGAIGVHVAQTLHYEEGEPVDEIRRRLAEERARRKQHEEALGASIDYYNTDLTMEEMRWLQGRAGILGRPRGLE